MKNNIYILVISCFLLITSNSALSAEVTLRFAHFWPSVAGINKQVFEPWAKKIEQDSNGRIKVEVYPSAALSSPVSQYNAVKKGIIDITATVQGYNAKRFPLTQIIELPGLISSAKQGSCMIQSLYDEGMISDEYKDTKPIFLFTHGSGYLHTKETAIKHPKDLKSLRIRRPTTVVAGILEELDAKPVSLPAPSTYTAMQRGVIDGVAFPWEGALSFRINEISNKHTEVNLYSLAFIVTMNKSSYNKLDKSLQKVIDENSGMAWSIKAGNTFDNLDIKGRAQAVKQGDEIISISEKDFKNDWQPLLDKVSKSYLKEVSNNSDISQKIYNKAKSLAKEC